MLSRRYRSFLHVMPSLALAVILLVGAVIPAVASEGYVVAWGRNQYGQCSIPSPNQAFTSVSGGTQHSLGLKSDGSVVAWGYNGFYQCSVPSPNSDFTAVAAGGAFSLGLRRDGSIVGWGYNYDGQCNPPSPNSDFTAIGAGEYHCLGLKSDGSIVTWGSNIYGQCSVPSPNAGFVAVGAGAYHSLGLKSDGSIVAWGWNQYGQCTVPSPNTGFLAIAAGGAFSLGLNSDGSIVAWGNNSAGECNVPTPNTGFAEISAGSGHSLGLRSDGSIAAWGANNYGQCNVPSPNMGFIAIGAGSLHSLCVRTPSLLVTFSPDGGTFYSETSVVVDSDTAGAVIHYTTNGIDPTEADPSVPSGGSVLVDRSMTLKAKAFKEGSDPGPVKSAAYLLKVAQPTINPSGGTFYSCQNAVVQCTTPGATIHYTTDGAVPTEGSPVVESGGSVVVDRSMTLKARAFKAGSDPSLTRNAYYTLVVSTPSLSPNGGTFESDPTVVITCTTDGASIHYTTDGSDPDEGDPSVASEQSVVVGISPQTTLKARGFKSGFQASQVVSAVYRAPVIYRVKPTGDDGADGLTWETAKRTVQAAIDTAANGDHVWVQAGTYVGLVTLEEGVKLYGGFAGAETERTQRDWTANVTTLDGSKLGTVVTAPAGASSATAVDGFTIRNGKGNWGGGVSCHDSSPTIANNTITANSANIGGGIYCFARAPVITNNIISGNSAGTTNNGGGVYCSGASPTIFGNTITLNTAGNGGGIYCYHSSSPKIEGNTISGNVATYNGGGGIYCNDHCSPTIADNAISDNDGRGFGGGIACNWYSSPTISNNTIADNTTDHLGSGGGIYCMEYSLPAISGNTISGNDSTYGGGIYCWGVTSPISDNTVSGNTASYGSGIYCEHGSTTVISGNTIRDNETHSTGYGGGIYCKSSPVTIRDNTICGNNGGYGAGVYCLSSSPEISNNIISANSCTYGGGVYCSDSSPAIWNNTITANSGLKGAGISCQGASSPAITNNIIAFNSSGVYASGGAPVLKSNCVWNPRLYDYSGVSPGTGDIQADPKLVAVGYGQVHVQPDSPCRDAGDDSVVSGEWLDMDGQARIQGSHVDIGADEIDGTAWTFAQRIVRVSPSGDDLNDGSTWELAKRTVQAAIDSEAVDGGDVWVAEGVYVECINVPNYVYLYGGFDGAETAREQRNPVENVTVLDADERGSVVAFERAAFQVSAIDGFTIRNGLHGGGAGIYCSLSWPTITDNTITQNVGGGIACYYGASPDILSNSIAGNQAGAGIVCAISSSPLISNNSITGNSIGGLDSIGGGVYCTTSSAPAIINNVISRNFADGGGGGIGCREGAHPTVAGNVITDNEVGTFGYGGGILCASSSPTITNNTIVGNTFGDFGHGGGIVCGASSAIISNNIIAFNWSGIYVSSGSPVLNNNCVHNPGCPNYEGTSPGANDIQADPGFADRVAGDYHLQAGSPCIGAGWNDAPGITPLDIDGQARIMGGTIDIGADEYEGAPSPDVVSILGARTSDAGRLVKVEGAIVSAAWPNVFYVEADDRSCGIRVEMIAHGRAEGTRATIVGTVRTNADGECFIDATAANPAGTGSVRPIGIVERALGGITGEQIAGGSGLGNIGLLIRAWGIVTQAGSGYLYIDDGSGIIDGTTTGSEQNIGVRVICNPTGYSSGDRVEVTGISSCFDASPALARRILARSSADVRKLDSP